MSTGLLLALAAASAWGLTDVAASIAGRRLGSLRVLAATQGLGAVVLGAMWLLGPAGKVADLVGAPSMVAFAALSGLMASAGYLGAFTALRIGPLSVVSPVISAYGGLTVVLAVVFRGEPMTTVQVAGAVVGTVGIGLVGFVMDDGWRSTRIGGPGVAFALLAMVGFALGTMTVAEPTRSLGYLPALTVARISSTALSIGLLVAALRVGSGWAGPLLESPGGLVGRVASWSPVAVVVAAGLLDVLGFVAFGVGLEVALVWLVGLVSSFGPVFAVGIAVLFLGERPRPVQWLGMAAIAVGIVLIGLP